MPLIHFFSGFLYMCFCEFQKSLMVYRAGKDFKIHTYISCWYAVWYSKELLVHILSCFIILIFGLSNGTVDNLKARYIEPQRCLDFEDW